MKKLPRNQGFAALAISLVALVAWVVTAWLPDAAGPGTGNAGGQPGAGGIGRDADGTEPGSASASASASGPDSTGTGGTEPGAGGGGAASAAEEEPTPQQLADALAALDRLPSPGSAGAAPPYEREAFLPGGWADLDHNGCYTRNEILARDLANVTYTASGPGCVVATGRLTCPYTGKVVEFDRAVSTQSVQIDHLIALAEAWRAGAWAWTKAERVAFANDPAELLAVSASANASKGASGPADWMPATGSCGYATAYADLADRYELAIPEVDRVALRATLDSCLG